MLLKDFAFEVPQNNIASHSNQNRIDSKLLLSSLNNQDIRHSQFCDLPTHLCKNDLIVLNTSKVIPAKLTGRKETAGKIELLLETIISDTEAWVYLYALKDPKPGTWLMFKNSVRVQVRDYNEATDLFLVSFHAEQPILSILNEIGEAPLPDYVDRDTVNLDLIRYQTVYADEEGSVALPASGLHFDYKLLFVLQTIGVNIGKLSLHLGASNLLPLRTPEVTTHQSSFEKLAINQELCNQIIATKEQGGKVIAIGTSVAKALEVMMLNGGIKPFYGETNLFIYPGFEFKLIDGLISNFHPPQTPPFMIMAALIGREKLLYIYNQAISCNYKFYNYGDAMLIT